ncbi:MAG: site-specific integrase [Ferruginibacter sp.]
MQYFLFSCYTGLRYSDIISLKLDDIKTGFVKTTQEKTDKPVIVPIIKQAASLITPRLDALCFKTYTNQATNRFLKLIMQASGIDKKITYHCSRHTFGTLSIFWGIPLDVVAELMGVSMKTVKIYAQIDDQVKVREMLKWENKTG